ncbi:hypothetical protein HER21_28680 [Pseudomonas sp. BGM005]|nr:hypothetical protein [Pseudomonas sp. BG5]
MSSTVAKTAQAFTITHCRHCGGHALTWATSILNRSNVQQGRLTTQDVECVFYLGCDTCSETLAMFSADRLADVVNARAAELVAAAETDAA